MPANPVIILVNPQLGENIGMCARAMLNCGVTELRLVAPRDGWPNESARSASAGAISIVEAARLYSTLSEAIADCHYVVACSARARDMDKPVIGPEDALHFMAAQADQPKSRSAVVFGPERAGLLNDDIALCDAVLNIPLNPEYASLNLAQAVLLVCYEWRKVNYAAVSVASVQLASKAELESVFQHLVDALEEGGFFTSADKRNAVLHNLRGTLQKAMLSSRDMRGIHGMIKSLRGGQHWTKKSPL